MISVESVADLLRRMLSDGEYGKVTIKVEPPNIVQVYKELSMQSDAQVKQA